MMLIKVENFLGLLKVPQKEAKSPNHCFYSIIHLQFYKPELRWSTMLDKVLHARSPKCNHQERPLANPAIQELPSDLRYCSLIAFFYIVRM